MTSMTIELTNVSPVRIEGKFPKMDINYVRDGKNNNRTLAGVGKTKDVITVLSKATMGDSFEILLEKSADDKFWNWVDAKKVVPTAAAETVAAVKTSYQTKSTYETPEERAKKQVYIIRQSSLANAIEFLNAQGKKFTVDEVLERAQEFVDFVFQTECLNRAKGLAEEGLKQAEEFKDDIPF